MNRVHRIGIAAVVCLLVLDIGWTVDGDGTISSVAAQESKPAGDQPKISYDEHVRPILREHCFTCHNQNGAKGGLALDSYAKAMEGGSSGQIVIAGDPDSSRLWALVSHAEEPKMPPMQDKLPEAKLNVLKQWIELGALENAGSKANIKKKPAFAMSAPSKSGKPDGNAAMPEGLLKQPVIVTPRPAAVTAVASSPWAPVVAVAGQHQIVLYHSDHGRVLGVLPFPEGVAHVLRFSRDGSLLIAGGGRGGHSGIVALFDVKSGKRVQTIGDELDVVLSADINNDHSLVALGGPQRVVRIYSTETGEKLHEIRKHTDWIYSVSFSPDGVLLATADRSGGLFVWESATAREYLNLRGHNGAVCDLSWRLDSNVLASGGEDTTVRLWEMNDGNQIKNWGAHGGGVMSLAYTHDGRIVTCGKDNTAKSWDGNGGALKTFPAFGDAALEVTFTHDGQRVVAGDWNGIVRMWNAADATELAILAPNPPLLDQVVRMRTEQLTAAQSIADTAVAQLSDAMKAADESALRLKNAADSMATAIAGVQKADADRLLIEKQLADGIVAGNKATEEQTVAIAAQRAATADRIAAEQASNEKAVAAKAAAEKAVNEKAAADKLAADKSAAEKLVADKTAALASATDKNAAQNELNAAAKVAQESAAAAQAALAASVVAQEAAAKAELDRVNAVSGLAEKTLQLQKVNEQLAATTGVVLQRMAELTDANRRLNEQSAAVKSANELVAAAKAELEKQTAEKAAADALVVTRKMPADAASAQLANARMILDEAIADLQRFQTAPSQLESAANAARQQLERLKQTHTTLASDHAAAAKAVAEKVAAITALSEKLAALQAELQAITASQKQLEELSATAARKLQESEAELTVAQLTAEQAAAEQENFSRIYNP